MAVSRTKELAHVLFDTTEGKPEAEQNEALKNFASYLAKKGLLKDEDAIALEYQKIYNSHHGIVEATVTLIARLSEHKRLELREALKKKYKAREVHILEKVDARLIGGMKIQVGDEVFDSSLQNSLDQLQAQLLK